MPVENLSYLKIKKMVENGLTDKKNSKLFFCFSIKNFTL